MANKKVSVRYLFGDDAPEDLSFETVTKSLSRQAVLMAESDDPEIQVAGDELQDQMASQAKGHALHTIKRAEEKPFVERDKKRQEGTKKERRPEITKWIAKQLQADPTAQSPDLWAKVPEWIEDEIGYDRFAKRVTQGRKDLNGRK